MQMNYVLAIHSGHNASVALMCNGILVAATQEERFCRKKNYIGFPKESIDFVLGKFNLKGADLSRIAYTTIGDSGVLNKAKVSTEFSLRDYHEYYGEKYYGRIMKDEDCTDYLRWLRDDPKFNKDKQYFDYSYLTDDVIANSELESNLYRIQQVRKLSEYLGVSREKIEHLDHHTCHAYYAYFGAPFREKDCIILTLDGWGDGRNQTVWRVRDDEPVLIAESAQNDIGRIYKMATLILGMRPDEHEFKVMGLAAYAKDMYVQKTYETIEQLSMVEGMRIIENERPRDLYSYLKEAWLDHRFDNIAGAVQLLTENLATELVKNIYRETGITRYVLSGGIAMNVKMNKAISDLDCVSDIFVCGSGGDESLSIGGCYYLNASNKNNAPLDNMYLGYDISDEFETYNWSQVEEKFSINTNISHHDVARLLVKGEIVAVIRGQAEFGARALGNRSILADPSKRETVIKINEAIKNRDFWMPFALSIMEEHHHKYIKNPKNLISPYMATAFDTEVEPYKDVEAGTHPYDKTARPQFVEKRSAPEYHSLISAFYELTGIPAVLNTSFNLHGEPIVNTISDALRTFELSGLDHLLINDRVLVSKIHKA